MKLNLFIATLFITSIFANVPDILKDVHSVIDDENDEFQSETVFKRDATLAAEYWNEAPEPSNGAVEIESSRGKLHVVTGSFDPLVESPLIPANLQNTALPGENQIYIVQLSVNNAEIMYELSNTYQLELLDVLPDTSWVVRLPANAAEVLSNLKGEDFVRWVGPQHPVWKLNSYWLDQMSEMSTGMELTFIPTPDLTENELLELRTDISTLKTNSITCDIWFCQVKFSEESITSEVISWLAHDERVLYLGRSMQLELTNYYAADASGINSAKLWDGGLDGSGEIASISDTGLDSDHGDFGNRVISIHSNFGLDTSTADVNSGHGTHVAATLLGDGSGDINAQGIAPAALLHMYQLEADLYGIMGRVGSIYDMLEDAHTFGARLHSTSWVDSSGIGEYTSDSRSMDEFLNDYPDFVGVVSVGNNASGTASTVAPPSTAKNTLSVGSSTSGSPGTPSTGSVDSNSSIGPTLDGRIKPDLVAPGVSVCSAKAQEAVQTVGVSCSSATFSDGTEKYMALTGASQATPVVSGAALLVRQFMREENSIVAESDLVRAILINGATDLGTPDIPNEFEGWGQLNLEQSLNPKYQGTNLNMWYDSSRNLEPGKSLLYTYEFDISNGLDITLVWNDLAGSAIASSTAPRLVNNLNLRLIAPDGTEFYGNVFSNGYSVIGGTNDDLNNVERIKLSPGQLPSSGLWTVEVSHAGGAVQDFAIVISSGGVSSPQPDLVVDSGSIWASTSSPLVNENLLIRASWFNQGTAPTGSYKVSLKDTTTGVELKNITMNQLGGGDFDTFQITHSFSQTGTHNLKLELDIMDQISEINDANNGVDNNIFEMSINIAAEGIRIVPLASDGTVPTSSEEINSASQRDMDPLNETQKTFDINLQHEGTSSETIQFTVTPVYKFDPLQPNMLLPTDDTWSYSVNDTGPYVMPPAGTEGSIKKLSITLSNLDADLESGSIASAGIVVVDVTARYQNDPLVRYSVRLRVDIDRVDDVEVLLAGSATAQPNNWAAFTYSVMNTGNAPATFKLECNSQNNWRIKVGDSISNSVTFEPRNQGEPNQETISVKVPPVIDGSPKSGDTDIVSCQVSSLESPTLTYTEQITVEVEPLTDFNVDITDQYGDLFGLSSVAPDRLVNNGDRFNISVNITNVGNVDVELDVDVRQSNNDWWMNLQYGDVTDSNSIVIDLKSSQTETLLLDISVPLVAEMGTLNEYTFTVSNGRDLIKTNITKFRLGEILDLRIENPSDSNANVILGEGGLFELDVQNHGNTDVNIEWTLQNYPASWNVTFYSNPPFYMTMQTELSMELYVSVPAGTVSGLAGEVEIQALVEAPSGLNETFNLTLPIYVEKTCWLVFDSDKKSLLELERGAEFTGMISIRNDGNADCSAGLTTELPSGWTIGFGGVSEITLEAGGLIEIGYILVPGDDAENGLRELDIAVVNDVKEVDGVAVSIFSDGITIKISATSSKQSGGLLGSLSPITSIVVFFAIILTIVIAILFIRRSGLGLNINDSNMEGMDTITSMSDIESRRDMAMSIGKQEEDQVSGSVSASEIAAALHQSTSVLPGMQSPKLDPPSSPPPLGKVPKGLPPALPNNAPPQSPPPLEAFASNAVPPVPATGLPPGWTIEQWKHYGNTWLEQQNK